MNNVERLDRLEDAVVCLIDMVIDLSDPTGTRAQDNYAKPRLLEFDRQLLRSARRHNDDKPETRRRSASAHLACERGVIRWTSRRQDAYALVTNSDNFRTDTVTVPGCDDYAEEQCNTQQRRKARFGSGTQGSVDRGMWLDLSDTLALS
jgi:hypothetical protein